MKVSEPVKVHVQILSRTEQTRARSQHPDMVSKYKDISHTLLQKDTHAYTRTLTPDEMLTITYHDFLFLASPPIKTSMVSRKQRI